MEFETSGFQAKNLALSDLNLEFELYIDDELHGVSSNGKIKFTSNSPQLTEKGKIWSQVSKLETSTYAKAMKGLVNDFGMFEIRLISPVEICEGTHTIPLQIENYNVWQQKISPPFGLITRWCFST